MVDIFIQVVFICVRYSICRADCSFRAVVKVQQMLSTIADTSKESKM